MLKKLLFLFVGLILGFAFAVYSPASPRSDKQNPVSDKTQKPLDTLTILETEKGRLEIVISDEKVLFQPFEIADSPYQSFSINKDDYPKLFTQGVANSSFILAEKQGEGKNLKVVLTDNQPDHGYFSPTYSIVINPFTGEVDKK